MRDDIAQQSNSALQMGSSIATAGLQTINNLLLSIMQKMTNVEIARPRTSEEVKDEILNPQAAEARMEEQPLEKPYDYIDVPFHNRQLFEMEMVKKGIAFGRAFEIETNPTQQKYIVHENNKKEAFNLSQKYKGHSIVGDYATVITSRTDGSSLNAKAINQERECFGDKPAVRVNNLNAVEAQRIALQFAAKGVHTVTEYHDKNDSYSVKVLKAHEAELRKEYEITKMYFATDVGKHDKAVTEIRQNTLNAVLNAYDEKSDKTIVVFDAENPSHHIAINKDGYREFAKIDGLIQEISNGDIDNTSRLDPEHMKAFKEALDASLSTFATPISKEENLYREMINSREIGENALHIAGAHERLVLDFNVIINGMNQKREHALEEINRLQEAEKAELMQMQSKGLSEAELQTEKERIQVEYQGRINAWTKVADENDLFKVNAIEVARTMDAPTLDRQTNATNVQIFKVPTDLNIPPIDIEDLSEQEQKRQQRGISAIGALKGKDIEADDKDRNGEVSTPELEDHSANKSHDNYEHDEYDDFVLDSDYEREEPSDEE